MLDATINLGTLIQTIAFVGSGVWFIWSLKTQLAILDHKQSTTVDKVTKIEIELEKLTEVIVRQAMQDQRLDGFDARLQEISTVVFKNKRLTTRK